MALVRRRAYFIDAGYKVRRGKTYVYLVLKGKKKTVRCYYQQDPYFLVEAPLDRKDELLSLRAHRKDGQAITPLRTEEVEKQVGLRKKKMIRLYCREPPDVPIIKAVVPYPCHEYNIPFTRRFCFDMQLTPLHVITYEREGREIKRILKVKQGDPKLTSMSFDIETYNPVGAPREDKDPAVMISYCGAHKKGVLTFKKSKHAYVETLASEKEMLERFCRIVQEEDPDVLLGYNSANFDLPYLMKRAELARVKLALGRFGGKIKPLKKGLTTGMRVDGRVHMDLFPIAKFFGFIGIIKAQNFTLDAIAEDVLNRKKVKMKKEAIWQVWDRGEIDHLCEYSLVDSELAYALGGRFLPLEMELSSVARMPLFETSISTSGQLVENLLMYHAAEKGILIPHKPPEEDISERLDNPIQGAFVKLPAPGIYENVAVLDFRGLYPSIIVSYNIDPGTLLKGHGQGASHDAAESEAVDAFESPTGARFAKKTTGLVPYVLDYLIDMRMKLKKALKSLDKDGEEYVRIGARSHALKILANSIAGDEPIVLKSPAGRMRIMPVGEFVDPLLNDEWAGGTQLGNATGWEAACFFDGKVQFKPIKKVMRHSARRLLKVRTKSGYEIKITPDHSVFSLNSNCGIEAVKGSALVKGSHIIIPKKLPALGKNPEPKINLLRELADLPDADTEDLVVVSKLNDPLDVLENRVKLLETIENVDEESNAAAVAAKAGFDYRMVIKNMTSMRNEGFVRADKNNEKWRFKQTALSAAFTRYQKSVLSKIRYDPNTKTHRVSFNEIKEDIGKIDDIFLMNLRIGPWNGPKIPCMLTITERVSRFLGYFVSEGHMRRQPNQRNGTSYNVTLTNFDCAILDDMEECAKSFGVNVTRGKHTVTINTRIIYLLMKYIFLAGEGAYDKDIPPLIFEGDQAIRMAFLKAYFLGDGNYEKHSKRYRFTTVSRKLANSLVALIKQLGISSVSIKRDSKFYRVVVFEDLFGYTGRMRNMHPSLHVPGRYIKEEIRELKNIRYYYAEEKNISGKMLSKFYAEYKKKVGRSYRVERLLSLLDSDLGLEEITSVEPIESEENVYDLSVEDAENFIGGFGLLCLHNSFYGYLGYARSRWYSRECAESVTAWGRKHIMETIEAAEKAGFTVLYSDTDSVFLLYKNKQDVLDFMRKVNTDLPEKMELELEGFYTRGVFVSKKGGEERGAKKKYALLGDDGRIKIRGFELVRRDWSQIAKETQLRVLEAILREGSKDKAVAIIRETVAKLQSGTVPLEMLAISTQLNKSPTGYEVASPELSAAKKLLKAGTPVEKGSMISYVVGKSGKSISEKAVPLELAKDYDVDYYINNQVLPAVMKIMKELGYDEYSMKFGGKQKSLESFF